MLRYGQSPDRSSDKVIQVFFLFYFENCNILTPLCLSVADNQIQCAAQQLLPERQGNLKQEYHLLQTWKLTNLGVDVSVLVDQAASQCCLDLRQFWPSDMLSNQAPQGLTRAPGLSFITRLHKNGNLALREWKETGERKQWTHHVQET